MVKEALTHEQLKEYIRYDQVTGVFTRLKSHRTNSIAVIKTCANHGSGYFSIGLFGKMYLAHRLAWCLVHGDWPKEQLDHINRDKIDNRIVNLRDATSAQNIRNVGVRSSNTSGFRGVGYHKESCKWRAQICTNGKRICLGLYRTAEQASEVYEAYAKQHHGAFYCQIN